MEKFGYVYEVVNKINDRPYLGQHVGDFDPSYLGSGIQIARAVKKYGVHSFEVKILAYAGSKEQLDELEKKYIAEYQKRFGRRLYNLHAGGTGWSCGELNPSHRPEVKGKIALGGQKRTGEGNGMWGRTHSPEMRQKFSVLASRNIGELNPMWGRRHSKKSLEKMSESHTGSTASPETRIKMSIAGKKRTGVLNSMYGKKHSVKACKQMSTAQKGSKNPMYGRRHSLDSIIRMQLRHKVIQFLKKQGV